MNASDPGHRREAEGLAALLPVPAERDLPAGRQRTLKEHLMTEFRATQPERRAAPSWRPQRKILLAAAASMLAGAAVAATLVSLPGQTGSPAPGTGGITAAQFLNKVADAAARAPQLTVRDNQYTYVASKVSFGTGTRAAPPHAHERQIWIPTANLCRTTEIIEKGKVIKSSDRIKPGSVQVSNGHGGWQNYTNHCPVRGGLNDPTYRSLQSLPTDPHALLALIYRVEKGAGQSPNQEAFATIGDLLFESLPPPAVDAALYRAAALIPGVKVVPGAVDAIGRHGVGVAWTSPYGETDMWIFDPHTFQFLGERETQGAKLLGKSAVLARAIVDHLGQLPHHG